MSILYDVRALEPGAFLRAARDCWEAWDPKSLGSNGLLMTAWQLAALPPYLRTRLAPGSAVTVPDFLNYARLLNTGQAAAMLRLAGPMARGLGAGIRVSPALFRHPLRAARQDFWLIAEILLRYDLALLPRDSRMPLLLHPYIADFAFAFERRAFVSRFFDIAQERGPRGVQTQQLPMALGCLARWDLAPDVLAFLGSPGDRDSVESLAGALRSPLFRQCNFLADVESLPADLQVISSVPGITDAAGGTIRSIERAPVNI